MVCAAAMLTVSLTAIGATVVSNGASGLLPLRRGRRYAFALAIVLGGHQQLHLVASA